MKVKYRFLSSINNIIKPDEAFDSSLNVGKYNEIAWLGIDIIRYHPIDSQYFSISLMPIISDDAIENSK